MSRVRPMKPDRGLSQKIRVRCCTYVDARIDVVIATSANDGQLDLEDVFRSQYYRIARVIAGVIRDHARAEELAVEVFLKWSRHPSAQGKGTDGWLYRTAIRMALNELRRETRRNRYESLFGLVSLRTVKLSPSPEEIRAAKEEEEQVRVVLNSIKRRDAELLLLRSSGLSYDELADTLGLNQASIGTLLNRAEQTFRKEYVRRYGE
jgi:RNA polymerase sigma factor (sigma-70 family)